MCINSSKNSSFLKRTPQLNPNAEEWRPPQLHHILPLHPAPAPPPPQPAALAAYPHQKLLWHLPHPSHIYHPMTFHMPHACANIVYYPPPFSFPAAAPPLFDGEKKGTVGQPEERSLDNCENEFENMIVKKRGVSKMWKPPLRLVWRPRKAVADGGAAASWPLDLSPSKKKVPASTSSRTTVMVRNIPNQLRRDVLLEFIDSYCDVHSLEYDFMYLPMDFRRKDNLGYAFVNFTSGGDALKFKKILHNYKWGTIKTDKGSFYNSKKICAITWARIQGKDRLVERFEDSIFPCDDPDFLPVVFDPPRGGSNTTSPVIVGAIGPID